MSRPSDRGRTGDRDLDDLIDAELRDHWLREAAANRDAGLSDDEALRAAKASFGGVVQAREQVRQVWRPQVD